MDTNSKLFAIAIAVTSLAMAPSLFNINAADCTDHIGVKIRASLVHLGQMDVKKDGQDYDRM